MPGAFALGQPLALPTAVVGVVQPQGRQLGVLALAAGRIQARKLVDENVHRPAVGDDVVQRHPQLMLFAVQAHQGHAQQRALLQVERLHRFGFALRQYFLRTGSRQIQALQGQRQARQDALQGLAILLGKHRTQGLVTLDQGLEAGLQCRFVQLATQAQGAGNVVRRTVRLKLPGQPQAILCQRLRQGLRAAEAADGATGDTAIALQRRHRGTEVGQGRCLEQHPYAHLKIQLVTQARADLGGGNRVATEQEEVIVRGHLLHAQLLTPQTTDPGLHAGRRRGLIGYGRCLLIRVARVAIEAAVVHAQPAGGALQLAAGGLRQRAGIEQQHHRRRLLAGIGDHLAQGLDQARRRDDFLHVAADLDGNADALLAPVIDREHRHPAFTQNVDFTLQGLFQILWVEVVPTHDQQVLEAAGNEQLAVTQKTQVAGTQPGAPALLDEGAGRGFGVAPVAFGDARATGPDFADLVVGQQRQVVRLDNLHGMPGLATPATHLHRAPARFCVVARQRQGIQLKRANPLASGAAADEQRGLGQPVTGKETLRHKATGSELVGEGLQAVLADRLGTGIGHTPFAQVKAGHCRGTDPLAAQPIGEVRPSADGAAVIADRLQPALRPGEEVRRGHQHTGHATEDRLQQAADQAHVVVQRQPADDHVIRVYIDAETLADQHFVGHQVAMADLHALGQGCGAGGVLQKCNVVGLQGRRLPTAGLLLSQGIDRQQLWRAWLCQHLEGLQVVVQGTDGQQQARFGIADDRQQTLLMMTPR
ncbi:hypothetical protein D3C78_299550 [compost metagenome]